MMLSIIVPHFNSPALLQRLLDSIPNQENVEVLVIDDLSNSHLKEYYECKDRNSDRNVIFLNNTVQNKGAGGARNVGLAHAKGKWLLFADSDDYFVDGFIDTISEYFMSENDLVYFSPISKNEVTGKEADRHLHYAKLVEDYIIDGDFDKELKLRYTFWSPCSKLVRRQLVEKYGILYDNTMYSNDVMFSTKTGHWAEKIEVSSVPIYCITEGKAGLTKAKDEAALEIRKRVFCNYYFYLEKYLSCSEMKSLGYGMKDYVYFRMYRLGLVKYIDIFKKKLIQG